MAKMKSESRSLSNRLGAWKFILAGIIMLAAISSTLVGAVIHLKKDIKIAHLEADGADHIILVQKLIVQLQRARGLASIYTHGDATVAERIDKLRLSSIEQVKTIKDSEHSAHIFSTTSFLDSLDAEIEDVFKLANGVAADSEIVFKRFTRLIGQLMASYLKISHDSYLPYDPEPFSYNMANAATYAVPKLMETIGQMRALASGEVAAKKIDEEIFVKIENRRHSLKYFLGELKNIENMLSLLNKSKYEGIRVFFEDFVKAANELDPLLYDIGRGKTEGLVALGVFEEATQVIDKAFVLQKKLFDLLLQELDARIYKLQKIIFIAYSAFAALVLLSVILLYSFYMSNRRSFKKMEDYEDLLLQKINDIELEKKNAEAANHSKSEFLSNMSHELRTPLNAIIGFSEMMKMGIGGDLSEAHKSYAADIHESGRHLLLLINEILDLSKIESGNIEITPAEVNIEYILDGCLMFFREKAMSKRLSLTTELPEALPIIYADEIRLKQVFVNLISNAVKFTPNEGKVVVSARTVAGEGQPGEEVEFTVSDTGPGISDEDIPKLFKSFQQLDSSYTKEHEGTGLGLALCRNIVELHGGRIWVESEVGKGSRFIFRLPLNQADKN